MHSFKLKMNDFVKNKQNNNFGSKLNGFWGNLGKFGPS